MTVPQSPPALDVLFIGNARLPCADGSAEHAGNVALMDWQADARFNLSDAVALLQFAFSGGGPHPLAAPDLEVEACVPIIGCPDNAQCP